MFKVYLTIFFWTNIKYTQEKKNTWSKTGSEIARGSADFPEFLVIHEIIANLKRNLKVWGGGGGISGTT